MSARQDVSKVFNLLSSQSDWCCVFIESIQAKFSNLDFALEFLFLFVSGLLHEFVHISLGYVLFQSHCLLLLLQFQFVKSWRNQFGNGVSQRSEHVPVLLCDWFLASRSLANSVLEPLDVLLKSCKQSMELVIGQSFQERLIVGRFVYCCHGQNCLQCFLDSGVMFQIILFLFGELLVRLQVFNLLCESSKSSKDVIIGPGINKFWKRNCKRSLFGSLSSQCISLRLDNLLLLFRFG
mmetsp:Transcript_20608/g.28924  ORF Transcript_20608/g.28924 Transcript_20608/m.28924 type:complete len:237 (-) Transcript_20608:1508-2218(-)